MNWRERVAPPRGARVLVAGGCGAIGRALVGALLELECKVAVLDQPASIQAHKPPQDVLTIAADCTSEAAVQGALAQVDTTWGALDALAFLVGFTLAPPRPTAEIDLAQWDEVVRGNLHSAHLVTRAALPLLQRGEGAAIVTVASGLAFSVLKGYGPYSAAKAGLVALTKILATENAPKVRANAIAPGAIQTDFMKGGLGRGGSDGAWFDPKPYIPLMPLQRIAEVEDVVGPALFLLSPGASFITGQTIHVNGGRFMP